MENYALRKILKELKVYLGYPEDYDPYPGLTSRDLINQAKALVEKAIELDASTRGGDLPYLLLLQERIKHKPERPKLTLIKGGLRMS